METIRNNALSLATIGIMVLASIIYLFIGVSVINGSGWDAGPRVAAVPTATPTPSPSPDPAPTPCPGDDPRDPKNPCPTPIPSPTIPY
jgi:hypothetical protein